MSLEEKPWLLRELLDFPFLHSPVAVVDTALDAINLAADAFFADLGCGDATVLIRAAQKSRAFCVGFEIDCRLLPEAKANIRQAGLTSRVDVVYGDVFAVDLSRFDAIYVYPFPTIAGGLSQKMRCECKQGATALVNDYPLPSLVPTKTLEVQGNDQHPHKVYIYKF
jgi:hypothetical protein